MNYNEMKDNIKITIDNFLQGDNSIKIMKRDASKYIADFIPENYEDKVAFVKSYYAAKVCKIDNIEDERLVHDILQYQINKLFFDALESFEREGV